MISSVKRRLLDPVFYEQGLRYSLLTLWVALGFSQALMEITFGTALAFWLIPKLLLKQSIQWDKAILITLGGYVLLSFLSLFWSEVPITSLKGIHKVFKPPLLFLITAEVFRKKDNLKLFNRTFTVFYLVLIADAFCQLLCGQDFIRHVALHLSNAGFRLSASFKTYGLFASYLICTLPYLGILGGKEGIHPFRWTKILHLCLLGMGLVLLYYTRSRGAFLAFGMGIFLLLLFYRQYWKMMALLLLGGICFIVMPKTMIIHEDITGREQSLIERYYLWDRALNVIKAKPLTGTGINTYTAIHSKYDKTKNWRVRDYYAHNGYLQLAAETGIPSLLFLLSFLSYVFYSTRKEHLAAAQTSENDIRHAQALQLGCLNFLIFMTTDTVFHNGQAVMVLWYLLGLLYSFRPLPNQASTC